MNANRFLGASVAAIVIAAVPSTAYAQQTYSFDVPAQKLSDSLRAIGARSSTSVAFDPALTRGKKAPAVKGVMSVNEALGAALGGSGLQARTSGSGYVIAVSGADQGNALAGGPNAGANNNPDPSLGDYDDSESDEIIVTAQKREERLIDVPVPVSAINAQELATTNQLRIQDYFRTIPGLSFALAGNGGQPVLTIRGINTGDAVNPAVGVVINEVSYGSSVATGSQIPAAPDIDPSDLERVEVLRGPQGTLYGASSIGGLIKFVTISPSTSGFAGRIQGGLSTLDDSDQVGYSLRGSVNVPLGDELAVRASGFFAREPGYVDNAEAGIRDANERKSGGGRLTALWRPSSDFALRLEAVYQEAERRGADESDTALGRDPAQAYLAGTGIYRRTSQLYTATANVRLGRVDVVAATGYSIDKLADTVDVSRAFGGFYVDVGQLAFGVDRALVKSDVDVSKFSQEIRATVPVSSWISWVIGGLYTRETTTSLVDTQAVDANRVKAGSLATFLYRDGRFEDKAVFSNVTFELSNRFDIQLGGRYSRNSQDYPVERSGLFLEGVPNTPVLRSNDEAFTYLVTPRFKITPDIMIYARFASGYRPGGPNVLCGEVGVPCTFSADTTQNYDLGVKGTLWDGLLTIDASLYYIDWKDLQIPNICTTDCIAQYTDNAGSADSKGLELALRLRAAKDFELSGWFAYNDAKLTEDLPFGSLVGVKGDRLPYGSEFSGSISARKEFALGATTTAYLQGTGSYVGRRTGDFKFTPDRQHYPAYVQIDLRAGIAFDGVAVDLYVNNLTNKRAVVRGGIDSLFEPGYVNYIQPRVLGVSVSKNF